MRNYLTLLLLALLTLSCNENRIFDDETDPSGNLEWNRDEVVSFDVEIIDISIKYNLFLTLRHATGFRYRDLAVRVTETAPDGSTQERDFSFNVMNDSGYNGEVSGDIYDLEVLWLENYIFPVPGIYHYELRHVMADDKVHMVMDVGMMVDKVLPNQP